tara:strand:- start:890 stop:1120 length:231 start_codon:yes stop_codon:yes gene_type:complete
MYLYLAQLMSRISKKLMCIAGIKAIADSYLVMPIAIFYISKSDLKINTTLEKVKSEQGENHRTIRFLKNLKPLTNF